MKINDLDQSIDSWIKGLEQYDFIQLCAKPSPTSWSLGQVCMHLIENTNYYVDQIKMCVSTNDNIMGEASPEAKTMFLNNEFPDEVIEGPPENLDTPQPDNKEQLMRSLLNLKKDINHVEMLILNSPYRGKTKHPGLNYFDAREWFQFADMHFRHHLRQKKRIEMFLEITRQ